MKFLMLTATGAVCAAIASENTLVDEIGPSAVKVKAAYSHTITIAALEDGDSDFEVKVSEDSAYTIELTEQQIEDILNGTTVHVDTQEGDLVVQITVKDTKPKSSGW